MLEVGLSCAAKDVGEFRPGVGQTHVHDPHHLDASSRWLDAEEARAVAALNAAPEFLFRRQKKVLIERIGWYLDLDPLAAAGDNREHRGRSVGDPHVMLELGHVLFRRRLLRERPGNMNLASNTAPLPSTIPSRVAAIQRITGWRTQLWTSLTSCLVARSYHCRLRRSVARPSCTRRLP